MITHVRIQNFRSFLDAEVDLQPFSLIVGANGSGKSNLLKFFSTISGQVQPSNDQGHVLAGISLEQHKGPVRLMDSGWVTHQNGSGHKVGFQVRIDDQPITGSTPFSKGDSPAIILSERFAWQGKRLPVFNIDPEKVSAVETTVPAATIKASGEGTTQVLDTLKNGDREDLFDKVEENFRRYVPEVEKLSLRTVENGKKQIQVRERALRTPVPATELSEGTRLILCVLTILHQENPPPVILLEDIDHGMHPRLFEHVAPLMRDIAERNQVNILATTHNPYLVDCFQDHKDAVIIVEKEDGASTLTTLAAKLEGIDYETVNPEDMPLGALWYSGLIGGTPKKLAAEVRH
ncbi:MAG TPA: AAA family ATPase [Chthoniobacterales bacterium]